MLRFALALYFMVCCFSLSYRAPRPPEVEAEAEAEAAVESAQEIAAALRVRPRVPCRTGTGVKVVDVSASAATPELVAQLIGIGEGERVTAVDDHAVTGTLAAGTWLAARFARELPLATPVGPGDFIDVTIEGASSRRVLVLFH
jgi:hypothetical protein